MLDKIALTLLISADSTGEVSAFFSLILLRGFAADRQES